MAFDTTYTGSEVLVLSGLVAGEWEVVKCRPKVGTTGWDSLEMQVICDVAAVSIGAGYYDTETTAQVLLADEYKKGKLLLMPHGRWIVYETQIDEIYGSIVLATVSCKGIGYDRTDEVWEPGHSVVAVNHELRYHMTGGVTTQTWESVTSVIDEEDYPQVNFRALRLMKAVPTITVETIIAGRPNTALVGVPLTPAQALRFWPEIEPVPYHEDWEETYFAEYAFPAGWHIINQEWETLGNPYNGVTPGWPEPGIWDEAQMTNMLTLETNTYAYMPLKRPGIEEAS